MISGWILFIVAVSFGFAWLGIRHVRGKNMSADDYYTSRNTASTFTATATLVASMVGAWILFSPAETATWAGITGLTGYALGSALPFFAFAIMASRLRSLIPEGRGLADYTRLRYGPAMHLFILGITIFYMTVFLTAELTGIALVVKLFTDIPLWLTVAVIAAGTFAYTARGGMSASIFTDRIQFMFIAPLLVFVLAYALSGLGGWTAAIERAQLNAPNLMDWQFVPGIRFGITLMIAILAANMFHQGFWQRVYSCRDTRTARRAFFISGLVVIPIILLPGIFGVLALANGMAEAHSSTALFAVIQNHLPVWLTGGFILLAICLVMSSLDTLMNGLSCTLATAGHQLIKDPQGWNRYHAVLITLLIPAAFVAAQGFSVLYLFLIADLVCAAVLIPVFMGMYVSRYSGKAAMVSSIAGIVAGGLFFMKPDFSPMFPIAGGGDSLISFSVALGVGGLCSAISALFPVFHAARPFDFETMTHAPVAAGKSA
jgi:Na+/proline symporter